ncbi:aldehyde dehydrogenase family protein [Mycolicibacterium sp. P9-22]|uniref:aldehyde dehydrogenase family protein n=1 Tax=Mycolicibacterium sp. P9-22 TaxID=2024613 RepID=UPI0011EC2C97|nr:aldehyde dehydrogenase family protein [Mycolicibacterium sp. P9-22]KAA0109978.1 aldehyde dehydrogenase family protein [Mycolicibacterium sp. P9-22]
MNKTHDTTSQSVHDLVARAHWAQRNWAALDHRERGRRLRAVRARLAARASEIAQAISDETGKPVTDGLFEIASGCVMLGWVANNSHRHLRDHRVSSRPYLIKRARIQYAPLGVVGIIAPWNYPVAISMQSLPFALGAGNAVVFKPSEITPRTGRLLVECFEPAGEDLVLLADGDPGVGAELVRSDIDKLVFTGSSATGRKILGAAAERLLPVVLELGGKDAMLVCRDANIRAAADTAVAAAFSNAGQTCMATERALVVESVYDEFVERVVESTRSLRVGPSSDAQVGPVAQPSRLVLIETRLDEAQNRGAKIAAGGKRLPYGPGWFEPTVVIDVPTDTELWREESFAPVLSVVRVRDENAAVELANDTQFGLSASIFTSSRKQADRLARLLHSGGVVVNDAVTGGALPGLTFGGVKKSGFGRLQGPEGLRELSRTTAVVSPISMRMPSLLGVMFNSKRPPKRVIETFLRTRYTGRRY